MKNATITGILFALFAAVCYGFIPYFTLPLKEIPAAATAVSSYMADTCILSYRFGFAALLIGIVMLVRRQSFKITRGEAVTLIYLAFISDGSALFLIEGYNYMSSGIATTLHFMYPVVTAVIMMSFYHEARQASTILAILMAVGGVGILSWNPDGKTSIEGVIIVLISAVCYALYLIRVNRSRAAAMNSTKLVFYVMLFGAAIFAAETLRQGNLQPIETTLQLKNLLSLAVVCTVVTNLCLVVAVKRIGSTMTAVIGALEPLTAVVIGSLVFSEPFTLQVFAGIALIIPSVVIIIYTRRR